MLAAALAPVQSLKPSVAGGARIEGEISAPMVKLTAPNGQPLRGAQNQTTSPNWSGYSVKGGVYTSAEASWTVPSVSYAPYAGSPSPEVTTAWVGIGGVQPDGTLIQLGTQQEVTASGETRYSAWYELVPAPEIPLGNQFPVSPGDTIFASLRCLSSCTPNSEQTWLLVMTNGNRWAAPFTKQVTYRSSLATAEWIMEATCINNCQAVPRDYSYLPKFGPFGFSSVAANGVNPNLSLAQNGIEMIDPNGGATATPSAPSGGNSFSVTYSGPGQPPPSPTSGYRFDEFTIGEPRWNAVPTGLNDAGRISGFVGGLNGASGFILEPDNSAQVYTIGGASRTYFQGISSRDMIVGYYTARTADGSEEMLGFYQNPGSNRIFPIRFPKALETRALGVNSLGHIVGNYGDAKGTHGFIFDGARYTSYDHPAATDGTVLYGINDSGRAVGVYKAGLTFHGFLLDGGHPTPVEPDGAFNSFAVSINNAGDIVGNFNLERKPFTHGFLLSKGRYTIIDAHTDTGTAVNGINSSGQILGNSSIGNVATIFLASPAGSVAAQRSAPASRPQSSTAIILER